MYILGISAYYHDSACALIKDGEIIAAAQEERFSRKKHDSGFPARAISYCLEYAGVTLRELDNIVFYDKPFLKFERLLETYLAEAPRGLASFVMAIPIWLEEKLFLKHTIIKELRLIEEVEKKELEEKMMFAEHHLSHAASAFYPSPFEEAAILTIDGVGEWTTTSLAYGNGSDITILKEIHFPHSLGLLYSAFTYYTGFKVNSGEYKLMGLAPYGEPKYVRAIKENLIDIKDDGSFRLNMEYFNYASGLTMTSRKFDALFGGEPRERESAMEQKQMDLARSIQVVVEEIILKLTKTARNETSCPNLCLAGGVALNCVANGKILKENIFDNIWIQPAAGDAGGALGAAYCAHYIERRASRTVDPNAMDAMKGAYLGPEYDDERIMEYLDKYQAKYHRAAGEDETLNVAADALAAGKVIGWHCGRMEFGPRALGARSIIGDPRSEKMQSELNLKIKYRESFRPFAPSVICERAGDYFELDCDSPYMLFVADVRKSIRKEASNSGEKLFGIDMLNVPRSSIPAVTHVDYSARVQTAHPETNPKYYKMIRRFEEKTGCGLVVNTSFNVRGEPIVCTPEDSYKCFMRTEMDILVIEDFILYKEEQPFFDDKEKWRREYELD